MVFEMKLGPPMEIILLVLLPIKSVLETKEKANSPSSNTVGAVFEYDLKICMVVLAILEKTSINRSTCGTYWRNNK